MTSPTESVPAGSKLVPFPGGHGTLVAAAQQRANDEAERAIVNGLATIDKVPEIAHHSTSDGKKLTVPVGPMARGMLGYLIQSYQKQHPDWSPPCPP